MGRIDRGVAQNQIRLEPFGSHVFLKSKLQQAPTLPRKGIVRFAKRPVRKAGRIQKGLDKLLFPAGKQYLVAFVSEQTGKVLKRMKIGRMADVDEEVHLTLF